MGPEEGVEAPDRSLGVGPSPVMSLEYALPTSGGAAADVSVAGAGDGAGGCGGAGAGAGAIASSGCVGNTGVVGVPAFGAGVSDSPMRTPLPCGSTCGRAVAFDATPAAAGDIAGAGASAIALASENAQACRNCSSSVRWTNAPDASSVARFTYSCS